MRSLIVAVLAVFVIIAAVVDRITKSGVMLLEV
jgi:hypothetical protein